MAILPKFVKTLARWGVDRLLEARGIRLPNDFHLRQRMKLLFSPAEPDVEGLASALILPGMHVIDVGANTGIVTGTFSRLVGKDGRVFAFEPDPTNNEFLRWNTGRFSNVECFNIGFSDAPGKLELYLNPISGTGNALFREKEGWKSVTIDCWTIDDFVKDRNLSRLDFVKIDVEGAEVAVLRGMRETARRFPEMKLIIEFCPKNLTQADLTPDDFFRELSEQGFRFSPISPTGRILPAVPAEAMEQHLNPSGYLNLYCTRTLTSGA